MITLYGFGEAFGVADASPFVLKADVYMRMAGIAFEYKTDFSNLQKAPKGKLPFIKDGDEIIADSFFILKHLQQKYDVHLDDHLTPEQRATAQLMVQALDGDFYWSVVYSRWVRDEGWAVIKPAFFDSMPFPLKYIVPIVARRGVKAGCFKQGISRHSDTEVTEIANATLASLSTLLGDKTYFFGDKPSTLDAVAFAFLAEVILVTIDSPVNTAAKGYDNLVYYCEVMNKQYCITV